MLPNSSQLQKIKDIIGKFKVSNILVKPDLLLICECLEKLLERVDDLEKDIKKLKKDK